jgi:replicative DNA helicase
MNSTFQRPPHYNIEAEESVLGSLMLDPELITRVLPFLKSPDFYREKNRWIYEALVALHERNEAIDLITVTDELERMGRLGDVGGHAAISQILLRVPTAIHVEYYARIVERNSVLRRLVGAAESIARLAYEETDRDVKEIIERAERELFAVSQHRMTGAMVPLKDILADFYELVEDLYMNRHAVGLQTGFTDLDRLLGGFQAGDLIVLAARPSMGKTALALSLTELTAVKHAAKAAFFSLEMGTDQIAQRLISSQTGIDAQRLRVGPIYEEDLDRVGFAVEVLGKTSIFVDETPAISPVEMRTKLRRVQSEYGLDLIVVDYLQLMSSGKGSENRVQEISYISRALKELAREFKVPLLALSQLSRGVESRQDKRPMLSDLRESGCLTGDTLITLADTGERVPMRDLIGKRGFAVWALNQETLQLERAEVSNAFSTGVKKVYKLTTRLGRTIRATANHKFLAFDGWKRLDEFAPEHHIALPRHLPAAYHQAMNDSELALLAHLIGDGCTLPRHVIQYTTREKDLAETVASLATEVFGSDVNPRINQERTWYQVYLSSTRHHTHGVRSAISEWLEELGIWGLRSYQKRVPNKVFRQPEAGIAKFLRHLWATDGCIRMRGGKAPYPMLYYATSSPILAYDVQSLLLRLGINARVKRVPQVDKGLDQYHTLVSGRGDILRFADLIGAVGQYKTNSLQEVRTHLQHRTENTNRDVIPSSIWQQYVVPAMRENGVTHRQLHAELEMAYSGMTIFKQNVSRERALRVATAVQSAEVTTFAQSDIYWDQVVSIEEDGEEEVFDLTVPGPHNFVANDIIAHNSIEQDSDVVMFIYRDEVYNKNTDRPNIAEIIVAKHRNGPTGSVDLRFTRENAKFSNLETFYADEDEYGPPPSALEAGLDDIIF